MTLNTTLQKKQAGANQEFQTIQLFLLVTGEARQVVVVLATGEYLAVESMLCSLLTQCLGVDEEPGKRITLHTTVLHLVSQLAIVALNPGEVDKTVLILQGPTARRPA